MFEEHQAAMRMLRDRVISIVLLLAVLSTLLIGAKGTDFMVMTVINKAGMDIAVSILAVDLSRNYYIPIPAGERGAPYVKVFTLVKDQYRMRVYYLDKKDPETGEPCLRGRGTQLLAVRNMRVVIGPCDRRDLPNPGEPTMYKFGRWRCLQ